MTATTRPTRARPGPLRRLLAALALVATGPLAAQVLDCTLNGEAVNPSHGGTTAGKTGMMRCVDRQTRVLAREVEYRSGREVGLQRWYEAGVLRRELTLDERGNRDGRLREWNARGVLVKEGNESQGASVGLQREWYDDGRPRSIAWWGDAAPRRGESEARREFDPEGRLTDLRCGPAPRLDDDPRLCGFEGAPSTVELYRRGLVALRVTHLAGRLQRREMLWDTGTPSRVEERDGTRLTQREFARDGTRRREVVTDDGRRVFEAEWSERGTPVREKRWANGLPERETEWYLNGQPRRVQTWERRSDGGDPARLRIVGHVEQQFADNGRLASEGRWLMLSANRTVPVGAHRRFDETGRLRLEHLHDDRGVLVRAREWDEAGRVLRDDEVHPDGSRKRFGTAPAE